MLNLLTIVLWSFYAFEFSHADFEFIPDSHHQQFVTFANFTGETSTFVIRNPDRAWAAVGGGLSVVGFEAWTFKTQMVIFGFANVAFHLNEKRDTVLTETIDARVGLAFESAFRSDLRASLGWHHFSGHTSDDVLDTNLVAPNLGDEVLQARLIYDYAARFRIGLSLKAVAGSEPGMKVFAGDQFVEWFPFGTASTYGKPTPYIAVGVEEWGVNVVFPTLHVQLGAYIGNHLRPEHRSNIRLVSGYYHGVDPRLKYAQFLLSRVEFGYAGLMFDI